MGENLEKNQEVIEDVDVEIGPTQEEETKNEPKQTKLTYEQLHNVAVQATQQAEMFQRELQKYQNEALYIRLDFLFKVVQSPNVFGNNFVKKCVDEIELLLTIPEKK